MKQEINKCLQAIFFFSNNTQHTKSFLTLTSYQGYAEIQQQLLYEENQLFTQEILSQMEGKYHKQLKLVNDPFFTDFYLQDQDENFHEISEKRKEHNLKSISSEEEQLQTNKDDALEIFNKSVNTTIHKQVPSLFQEKENQYRTIRERIQEKLQQQQGKPKDDGQVIINRFANASQSPASRYHSKSPKSRFTKEFEEKFKQINTNMHTIASLALEKKNNQNHNPSNCEKSSHLQINQKTVTPKKMKQTTSDSTVQIRLDIQKFQESIKKMPIQPQQTTLKKDKQNNTMSRLNSRDVYSTKKSKQENTKSKSPISCSPIRKIPSESQHIIVNLYQKKR